MNGLSWRIGKHIQIVEQSEISVAKYRDACKFATARKGTTPIGGNLRESNVDSASHTTPTGQKPESNQ
jgi:hypothetical protein